MLYILGMDELFFLVEESPDGGYSAKALGESIFSQGDTIEELKSNIRDAIECHYDYRKPLLVRLHIVRDEVLSYA